MDWQLAGMAAKTLWNYLAKLKTAMAEGHADELIFADQLTDLVDLLSHLLSKEGAGGGRGEGKGEASVGRQVSSTFSPGDPPADEEEREIFEGEFVPAASQLHTHLSQCLE